MSAARRFRATVEDRGYRPIHTSGCRCPGCGLSSWHIGRTSAECGRCGTVLPLSPEPRQPPAGQGPATIFSFRRGPPAPVAPAALPLAAGAVDPEVQS